MKPKQQIIKKIDDEEFFTKEVLATLQAFKLDIDNHLREATLKFASNEEIKHDKLVIHDGTNVVKNFIVLNIEMKTEFVQLVPQTKFEFEPNLGAVHSSRFSIPVKVSVLQGKGICEYTLYTLHFEMFNSIDTKKCIKLSFRGTSSYNVFSSTSLGRTERKLVENFNNVLKSEIEETCKSQFLFL